MAEIDISEVLNLALKNLPSKDIQQAMLDEVKQRMESGESEELELYKLFAGDSAFKASWTQSMQRSVGL